MRERYTVWKVFARAWVLLVMLPLQVVACREDGDFHYYYVRDFRFFEPVRRVTQITQEKMFARRRGTYVADLGEDAERWRVRLGKNVRRLFIDVSTNKIARVFFECADGEYVTCSEFLKGRMSDTCFFWGDAGNGIAARYGVLGEYLPVAFSYRTHPKVHVLKRLSGSFDTRNVGVVPHLIPLCGDCVSSNDVFSLVCETESAARITRLRARREDFSEDSEYVAYYVRERPHRLDRASVTSRDASLPEHYWVLTTTGTFWTFDGDGVSRFRRCPYLRFAWWEEFEGTIPPIGNILLHDVSRDKIIEIDTVFGLSQSLDARIVQPGYFRARFHDSDLTIGEKLDQTIASETKKPEEMFLKSTYRRLKDVDEDKNVKKGLADAIERWKKEMSRE